MPPKKVGYATVGEIDEVIQTITALPRTDETTPIEFRISPRPGHLILPQMRLADQMRVWRVNIATGKREALTHRDNVCFVDFIGMTRFKLIEVYINGTCITRTHYNHGLVSYLRALTKSSA